MTSSESAVRSRLCSIPRKTHNPYSRLRSSLVEEPRLLLQRRAIEGHDCHNEACIFARSDEGGICVLVPDHGRDEDRGVGVEEVEFGKAAEEGAEGVEGVG